MTWRDLLVQVQYAPPGTAVYAALNPRHRQTDEANLLRSLEYGMRLLLHRTPVPRGANSRLPEPYLWPWEKEEQLASLRRRSLVGDEIPYEVVAAEMMSRANKE